MKKIIFLLMFTFSFSIYSYADDNTWITLGYSYYLPEESGAKAPLGPVSLIVGGQIMDWVAVDLGVSYLWDMKNKNSITDINTMTVKLHAVLQPKIETDMFYVLPYLGIGPQASANNTDYANNIFSYGFSTKIGVRFMEDGFILGVGAEYMYNPVEVKYNDTVHKYNGSGFLFGAEIGTVF